MHLPKLFASGLVLLVVPSAVTARRGGGGGGIDTDTSSDGDGGSSSAPGGTSTIGGGSKSCGPTTEILYKSDLVPMNSYNWTSKGASNSGTNPTTYDGSYFQGEAFLHWQFTAGRPCQNSSGTVRMLGYAWVGPQPPYPTGPTNPIIIGFKAWQTNDALENITFSYDFLHDGLYCPTAPDLVKIKTSNGWTDYQASTDIPRADRARAHDVFDLDLALDAERPDSVRFNGSMVPGLKPPPTYTVEVLLPASACNRQSRLSLGYGEELNMSGSLTNTTLELSLAGVGKGSYASGSGIMLRAMFNITFSGTFDSGNSTRAVAIKPDTQPMVFWVDNGAMMHGCLSWMLKLMFIGWVAWFVCC
ncbi:hypothetical protein LV164_006381 [Aspergillus fumigatus]|nr:hypothetical protein KXX42_002415 [Aspergillus fumigatus]KAH2760329.1 hypothetical protein KXV94_007379 [Aspergillus fumigatus]KAH3008612.1 hypothetical protein KXW60_001902 [Aspergillus fumigatus]KAH3142874.1 hypothetical protein KXW18_000470 [Aspergillus fumigatus]KAH3192041.1 hypothetical protein KXV92_002438 [Aspergillus fumigatus]